MKFFKKKEKPMRIYSGLLTFSIEFPGTDGFFIISEYEQKRPIGYCLITKDGDLMGVFIEPNERRKGYMTDAIKSFGDDVSGLSTSTENTSMQAVAEKLGWKKWLRYEASSSSVNVKGA